MNKSNPPIGFTSRDWPGLIKIGGLMPSETRTPGLAPTPVSGDGGKTLDWSQTQKHDNTTFAPLRLDPAVERKCTVARSPGIGLNKRSHC